jgi:hypothetical protein
MNARNYGQMVVYVSAVDSALIAGLYLFVGALWRDALWLRSMTRKQESAAFLVGLLVAAGIEFVKVTVLQTWSYTSFMPVVFGIGLSPLLQLSLTGALTFRLSRRLLYARGTYFTDYERA